MINNYRIVCCIRLNEINESQNKIKVWKSVGPYLNGIPSEVLKN